MDRNMRESDFLSAMPVCQLSRSFLWQRLDRKFEQARVSAAHHVESRSSGGRTALNSS